MATLHMICGLPGAGKSTHAERLERETGALRLTVDAWMSRLRIDGYDEARRTAMETLQWELAQSLLARGVDVILEPGYWTRAERDAVRARVAEIGAVARLHFLDTPRDELVRRIERRNAALPADAFHVDPADLDGWIAQFERPDTDELA